MELLEKLPDVTVKGDGAEIVKHVSSGSAKQIMAGISFTCQNAEPAREHSDQSARVQFQP